MTVMTPNAIATESERIDRGQRAAAALAEFLAPAFAAVEADYAARLVEIAAETPWETGRIAKLAAAVKVARTVHAQIAALIADGEVAAAARQRSRQIEGLSTERRRILGV